MREIKLTISQIIFLKGLIRNEIDWLVDDIENDSESDYFKNKNKLIEARAILNKLIKR